MKDFIIDFEGFSSLPNSLVVDMSVVLFDPDPTKMETFEELIKSGRRWKFDIQSQRGSRHVMPETIQWWKEQSPEARKNLVPSPNDVDIKTATLELLAYLKSNGVNNFRSQGWSRGTSYDFTILVDLIRNALGKDYTQDEEPVMFWAQRDIRTAIEALSLQRGVIMTPLRHGVLDGFVAHDSIHDCAKDVIMLKTAQRYAHGLEIPPKSFEIDPTTIKPKHLQRMIEMEKAQ